MKKLFSILFILVFTFGCRSVKVSDKQISEAPTKEETLEIISELASEKYEGRKPGTESYGKVMDYVEAYLKNNDVKPFFENSYRDTVVAEGKTSSNIVGLIGDYDRSKKHILIGAHLDHIGKSTRNSKDSVFNGANDDASGSTAVLQIARHLNQKEFDQNIIVALFTEEESGLVGSKHLAESLKKENVNLAYMINFEMIGKILTTGKNQVYITGYDKSNCAEVMNNIAGSKFVNFLPEAVEYDLFRRSDNYSFYQAFNVPCHTISSFDFKNYPYYHHLADEVQYLDIENMNQIIITSANIIEQMLQQHVELKTP